MGNPYLPLRGNELSLPVVDFQDNIWSLNDLSKGHFTAGAETVETMRGEPMSLYRSLSEIKQNPLTAQERMAALAVSRMTVATAAQIVLFLFLTTGKRIKATQMEQILSNLLYRSIITQVSFRTDDGCSVTAYYAGAAFTSLIGEPSYCPGYLRSGEAVAADYTERLALNQLMLQIARQRAPKTLTPGLPIRYDGKIMYARYALGFDDHLLLLTSFRKDKYDTLLTELSETYTQAVPSMEGQRVTVIVSVETPEDAAVLEGKIKALKLPFAVWLTSDEEVFNALFRVISEKQSIFHTLAGCH